MSVANWQEGEIYLLEKPSVNQVPQKSEIVAALALLGSIVELEIQCLWKPLSFRQHISDNFCQSLNGCVVPLFTIFI